MNFSPLFSVIIPTYHRNDLLAKCLDCLAPGVQMLPAEQYEVIVTDDGSETTAEEMLREHYPWAKWVAGPRKGPAANRNNGAKHALGEWLVFTDDDCLPNSCWLLAFSSAIAPDINVYEGKTTCEAGLHSPLEQAPINLRGGKLWSCNLMIRASLFKNLGGFDENFPYPHMEDVDLRDRIQNASHTFQFTEDAVVDHPPKRMPWGNQLGAWHESDFYYWHTKKNKQIVLAVLVYEILQTRLKDIIKRTFSTDSFMALVSLVIELHCLFKNFNKWHQNYPVLMPLSSQIIYEAVNQSVLSRIPKKVNRILDIGCGAGNLGKQIKQEIDCEVIGITYSESEAALASQWLDRVVVHDLNSFCLHELGEFDCIVCSHILEHLYYPQALLNQLHTHLKNDGIVIVALPNVLHWKQRFEFLRGRFRYTDGGLMDKTHFRFFDWHTAHELLEQSSYKVLDFEADGSFPLLGIRKLLLPQLVSWIDKTAVKKFPGLFGFQLVFSCSSKLSL